MTSQDFVVCVVMGVPASAGMLWVAWLDYRGKL